MALQTNTKNLINCCLSVVTGQHKPIDISDFDSFYSFCLAHKLENLACLYLSETESADNDVMLLFKDKYKQSIFIDMMMWICPKRMKSINFAVKSVYNLTEIIKFRTV